MIKVIFNSPTSIGHTVIVKILPGKGHLEKFYIVDKSQGISYGMSIGFKLT